MTTALTTPAATPAATAPADVKLAAPVQGAPDADAGKSGAAAGKEAVPGAEAKTEAPVAEAAVVADAELKFPDGFTPDVALIDSVKPLFKEFGLKGEQQQKLVDAFVARQAEAEKAADAQFAELKADNLKTLKADKEIGGQKFEATLANVQRAYGKYGTPALTQLMESSGMGNHPEVVRAFARIGAAMADDTIAGPRGGGPTSVDPREKLFEQYPTMRPGAVQPGPKQP